MKSFDRSQNANRRTHAKLIKPVAALLDGLVMFEYAFRMGHGYGYGMGPGMMGGYRSSMGRGYGGQPQSTGKSVDAKEAEVMMKD